MDSNAADSAGLSFAIIECPKSKVTPKFSLLTSLITVRVLPTVPKVDLILGSLILYSKENFYFFHFSVSVSII